MLSNASEIKQRLHEAAQKRMESIYAECDKKGLSRRYADNFYYRMTENPLKHTKSVVEESAKASKYNKNTKEHLSQLKTMLEIMLDTHPKHPKATEWEQSLKLLDNNNK